MGLGGLNVSLIRKGLMATKNLGCILNKNENATRGSARMSISKLSVYSHNDYCVKISTPKVLVAILAPIPLMYTL